MLDIVHATNTVATGNQGKAASAGRLRISGGSDTITVGTGSYVSDTGANAGIIGSGSQIDVAAGITASLNGSADWVTAGAGSQVGMVGSSNNITGAAGSVVTLLGTSETVGMTGGTVALVSGDVTVTGNANTVYGLSGAVTVAGTSENVIMTTGSLTLAAGAGASVTGSNVTINAGAGAALGVAGNGDVVLGAANVTLTVAGLNDSAVMSNGTIGANVGTGLTIVGSQNLISAAGTATLGISGSANQLWAAAGDVVTVGGTNNGVTMSGGTLGVLAGSTTSLLGGTNTVVMGQGNATVNNVSGDQNTFLGGTGTGDVVFVGGQGDAVNMSSGTLNMNAGASASLTGGANTIGMGQGKATVNNVSGDGNTFFSGTGTGDVVFVGGINENVNMSNGILNVNAGGIATLTGNLNTVGAGQGNALVNMIGNGNTINGGAGDLVYVHGTTDTANMSGASMNVDAGSSVALTGDGNAIGAGQGDATISITGSNNTLQGGFGSNDKVASTGLANTFTMSNSSLTVGAASTAQIIGGNDTYSLNGVVTTLASMTVQDVVFGTQGVMYILSPNKSLFLTTSSAPDASGSSASSTASPQLYSTITSDQPFSNAFGGAIPPEAWRTYAPPALVAQYDADQKAALAANLAAKAAWATDLNNVADDVSNLTTGLSLGGEEPAALVTLAVDIGLRLLAANVSPVTADESYAGIAGDLGGAVIGKYFGGADPAEAELLSKLGGAYIGSLTHAIQSTGDPTLSTPDPNNGLLGHI